MDCLHEITWEKATGQWLLDYLAASLNIRPEGLEVGFNPLGSLFCRANGIVYVITIAEANA